MMKEGDPGFGDLKVCPTCGWHMLMNHAERCEARAGRRAKALMQRLAEVPSTQLGYGSGIVVFEPPEQPGKEQPFNVRFDVSDAPRAARPFSLREVWLLDDLDAEDAASLVRALKAWRNSVLRRRAR